MRSSVGLLMLLAACGSASGYWLDPSSCGSNSMAANDIVYSDSMAKNGYEQLVRLRNLQSSLKIQRLATLVLGDHTSTSAALDHFESLVRSGVLRLHQQQDEVRVYCDLSHLELDAWGANTFDRQNNITHDRNLFELCEQYPTGDKPATYTDHGEGNISTIHICPQFLSSTAGQEVRSLDGFLSLLNDGNAIDMSLNMDSLHLFDGIMLREFFRTIDRTRTSVMHESTSLSWDNVKKGASQNLGGYNAESLAYFAIGATLIVEQGWEIREDGTFSEPDSGSAVRTGLGVQRYWHG